MTIYATFAIQKKARFYASESRRLARECHDDQASTVARIHAATLGILAENGQSSRPNMIRWARDYARGGRDARRENDVRRSRRCFRLARYFARRAAACLLDDHRAMTGRTTRDF